MFTSPAISTRFRRRWLARLPGLAFSVVALSGFAGSIGRGADPEVFQFHHEGVLGTSLDLQVNAVDAAQAAVVETAVLEEIERLRKILRLTVIWRRA